MLLSAATRVVDVAWRVARGRRPRQRFPVAPPVPSERDAGQVREYVETAREVHLGMRARAASVPSPAVTVVCVTKRPHCIPQVVDNFQRQAACRAQLLVIAHGCHLTETARAALHSVRHIAVPAHLSLGACLNLGVAQARTRYVAKFDDDDFYGENYLVDTVMWSHATGAALVGKHSYFVHLGESDRTILRFPGRECRPTTYLAGGTLFLDLERLGGIRFPDRTIGEDQGLIRRCIVRGRGVFAGDSFNYVQCRGTDNTWVAAEEYMARDALEIGPGSRLDIATL